MVSGCTALTGFLSLVHSFFFFYSSVLRFELRTWHLLGKCSATWVMSPALFVLVIFQIGSLIFCLGLQSLYLHVPHSLDCRLMPPHSAGLLRWSFTVFLSRLALSLNPWDLQPPSGWNFGLCHYVIFGLFDWFGLVWFSVLGLKPRALCMLDRCFSTELHPSAGAFLWPSMTNCRNKSSISPPRHTGCCHCQWPSRLLVGSNNNNNKSNSFLIWEHQRVL
jgi:hypothetical protein